MKSLRIGNRAIGKGSTFITAEIGSNHNGNFPLAKVMIGEVSKTGADAVKFQIYRAERLVAEQAVSMSHTTGISRSQFERFKSLEFSLAQWSELAEHAKKCGLIFLATPFDEEIVDFIDSLVPAFKIASGDLTNLPLIHQVASKKKPIILSTGMASEAEIGEILKHIPEDKVILLHCTSLYPTPIEKANLSTIPFLHDRFRLPVGYSDHTESCLASLIAVGMGAVLVEKHFTLNKAQPFGDHPLSAEPDEFKNMVEDIRRVERSLGKYGKILSKEEQEMSKRARRSLVVKKDIKKGECITKDSVISLRPGTGISPLYLKKVIGKRSLCDLKKGTIIVQEDIE